MDIRKPKPFHGWQELAREIGVIVIGVLIALGAEEGVRWLHQRAEVADAREALRSEIATNLANAHYTVEEERCLSVLWDRYAAWAHGGPHPPTREDRATAHPGSGSTTIWEVVKTGAVMHMAIRERQSYAEHYGGVESDARTYANEYAAFRRVVDRGARATLAPADAGSLLGDLREVRVLGQARSHQADLRLQLAKARLGITPGPLSAVARQNLTDVCDLVGMAPNL
jgi:hypothetical protein